MFYYRAATVLRRLFKSICVRLLTVTYSNSYYILRNEVLQLNINRNITLIKNATAPCSEVNCSNNRLFYKHCEVKNGLNFIGSREKIKYFETAEV